jgi:hypothetical protein
MELVLGAIVATAAELLIIALLLGWRPRQRPNLRKSIDDVRPRRGYEAAVSGR